MLLVSPLGFPVNNETKYAGIERLVWEYARELNKRNHEVTVIGHSESVFPEGVKLLSVKNETDEIKVFARYESEVYKHDVIHDFSHQHLIGRYKVNLPYLGIFWHAPRLAQYPKSPYNIIALSRWAAREFQKVYQQKALYQYSIGIDTSLYKPCDNPRNNRFLAIGRMGEEKGNLIAAEICDDLGYELDILGPRGLEGAHNDYENAVLSHCDDRRIRWIKDASETVKIQMMQTNKALIYPTWHPEVTSHKDQECLLCGMPAIVRNIGAAPEIITHGKNGFLCNTDKDFVEAMKRVDELDTLSMMDEMRSKWSIEAVIDSYLPLYDEVANGRRW